MSAMQAEFLADISAVSFDGARAGAELIGNVFARFVFSNQLEHASLCRRERVQSQPLFIRRYRRSVDPAFNEVRSEGRTRVVLTSQNSFYGADDVYDGTVLQYISPNLKIECALKEIFVAMHGE